MRSDTRTTRFTIALASMAGAILLYLGVLLLSRPAPGRLAAAQAPASEAAGRAPVSVASAARTSAPAASAANVPRAASAASAAPAAAPVPPAAAPAPAMPAGTAGMLVGIDPETGKLGPPSRDFRAKLSLSPALDRSMAGLTVVTRPDGSKHLDLQGRFQEYMVIHLTSDGRKEQTCVQGPEVEAALKGTADARPSSEYEVR